MPSSHPNQLIVEGHDDKHCVVSLMAAHLEWPDGIDNAPVHIEVCGSSNEILKDGFISTLLKSPPLRALGVLIDADNNAQGRYQRIRQLALGSFPTLPDDLPNDGVIVANENGKRFGLWIMPDNQSGGYLEGFLRYLVPQAQ